MLIIQTAFLINFKVASNSNVYKFINTAKKTAVLGFFYSSFSLKTQELVGHGFLKKVNFYFIFSKKLIFRGKCH